MVYILRSRNLAEFQNGSVTIGVPTHVDTVLINCPSELFSQIEFTGLTISKIGFLIDISREDQKRLQIATLGNAGLAAYENSFAFRTPIERLQLTSQKERPGAWHADPRLDLHAPATLDHFVRLVAVHALSKQLDGTS